MNFLDRITNTFLKLVATGRIARKGALFRVNPDFKGFLTLHSLPNGNPLASFLIKSHDRASLLVLKVQEEKFLWEQWVKVLFCRLKGPNSEDTMVGWMPYHEFNIVVLPQWQEEESP